ncbi:cell wall surface anchor family protein,putative [Streptococcus gallolyticus subsp. gallolyticus DSM 16831]|nr:cell wall surface anchor family protein,putative [Streptococcus gallolyticus subsp. gallolyticus DSM 16831]
MTTTTGQIVHAASGNELTNVITDISLWDVNNGQTLQPNSSGTYNLVKDNSYRYETTFDLSKYDGKLNDGDYFIFTVPAPITVENTSFDLEDKETGVAMGTAVVTSSGDSKGGTVNVTLKNLKDYLAKKGGSQVQGVKGTFYTDFKITKVTKSETLTYSTNQTTKEITHTISVTERGTSDYTDTIGKENFAKIGGVMKKESWSSEILNKSGEYIHNWYLRVNTNQSTYDSISLKDAIPSDSAPMQYIPEKLKIYAGYYNTSLELTDIQLMKKGEDYTIEYNSAYTSFNLKILNTATRLATNGKPATYSISYSTTSPANGTDVVNELSMTGGEQEITTRTDRTTTINRVTRSTKITTGGTIQLETGYRITLYKQDAETGNLLNGAEFEITSPSGDKETVKIEKDGVAQSKVYSAEEAKKGKFTIVEIKAPKGYVLDQTPIEVSLGENGIIRTIKNSKEKLSIPVTKQWNDNNNQDGKRPEDITVQLYANGQVVDGQTMTLNNENNWTAQFENLAKIDDDGKEIAYTVKEISVDGYTSNISGDTENGYTITNTYSPGKVEISGTKTWSDNNNQDGKRPDSITINLLADGEKVDSQTVTANNNWAYNFTDLAKYKDGKEVVYTVTEDPVSDYTTTINGYNITNSYTPATTSISGTKTWSDNDNQDGKRPDSITINLLANGKKVDSQKVSAATNWAYHFGNLPQYENGQVITYTVNEDAVDSYSTSINGYNITNSYTPETVDVKATKNWDDNDNQDGKRPTSITVNLLADGEKINSQKVVAAADGTWTASFTNLPKYKDGKEIKYTVTEEAVEEYETIINDFTITNKYIPKAIEYKVTKVWKDNNNQDGKRPSAITVQLYKSVGEAKPTPIAGKTLTLTADNQTNDNTWEASFTNLPQFEKGQEIAYSVQEVDTPEGYTASVEGQTITNSHDPETIIISGQKKWDDNDNQDGKRTTTVKVQILKGEEVVDEIEVSEASNWAFTSKALPKYENGKEITYTVKEVAVTAYETKIEKDDDGQYTITNTHTPEKINLSGQKVWNDNNNQDGIRPENITVELLANGEATGQTATASEATAWQYSFENLDRYKDSKEVSYSVKEVNIPEGYKAEVDGMNVTNNHVPETITLTGQKTWDDNNDQDGIRPQSITLHLLANGVDTGLTTTATADTNWTYSFKDIAKYQNGKEVTYTVSEDTVGGYTSVVDGMNVTNTHTPTTPTTPKSDKPNSPSSNQKNKPKQSSLLPATGDKGDLTLTILGVFLIVAIISGMIYYKIRKM